MLENKKQVSK